MLIRSTRRSNRGALELLDKDGDRLGVLTWWPDALSLEQADEVLAEVTDALTLRTSMKELYDWDYLKKAHDNHLELFKAQHEKDRAALLLGNGAPLLSPEPRFSDAPRKPIEPAVFDDTELADWALLEYPAGPFYLGAEMPAWAWRAVIAAAAAVTASTVVVHWLW